MRVCYFIQSHRDPEQIARLVRTLHAASPAASVLVGHDARLCELPRADLPDSPAIEVFYPPPPIERGSLSLLSPLWQAIDRLRERGLAYDWLVYLSGQDFPTLPVARAEAFLAASPADGYLTWWDAFQPVNPWGRRRQGILRYRYQYRRAPGWTAPLLRLLRGVNGLQRLVHVHLTYGPNVGLRARRTPFDDGRICYAGSQWSTLRRAAVELLRERVRAERELVAWYERTICSDESLVQTILVGSGRFRLVDDNLRYVDVRGSRDGRPRTLTAADFDEITSGRYHFARKFDRAVDARILDRLEAVALAT